MATQNASQRTMRCPFGIIALALAAAAGLTTPAVSQESVPGIEVEVTEMNKRGQLIRVAVNKAVMLKFNAPIDEPRLINSEIAEVTPISPTQLVINGKAFGTTQLIVRSSGNGQRVFDIAVDLELERLAASIRTAVPRANVRVYALLDAVVLSGTAPDTHAAERIEEIASVFSPRVINHLQVAGQQQVLLRCTVAEVNRTATRQLGFNGWIAGDGTSSAFGVSNIGNINPVSIGPATGSIVSPPQALGNTTIAPSGGIVPFTIQQPGTPFSADTTLSLGFPQVPMQIFIRALRDNGLLKVLAEPNLVAISGHDASFLAGGRFPIPVPQGEDTITIEYEEFGVRLDFTPTVLNEGRIRLRVQPEVSEPDFSTAVQLEGVFVPGVTERTLQTIVEVGSGQTIALGGLLSERSRGITTRVPGLGDLPILGALFRSVEYQTEETELVILVTPELVSPISPQDVHAVPGYNEAPPTDAELYLEGKLTSDQPGARPWLGPNTDRVRPKPSRTVYGDPTIVSLRGPVGPSGSSDGF